jgi:hypothetical protein
MTCSSFLSLCTCDSGCKLAVDPIENRYWIWYEVLICHLFLTIVRRWRMQIESKSILEYTVTKTSSLFTHSCSCNYACKLILTTVKKSKLNMRCIHVSFVSDQYEHIQIGRSVQMNT